ncbi:MAG: HD domain-containing protein [Solirubrobacterales bacterium]
MASTAEGLAERLAGSAPVRAAREALTGTEAWIVGGAVRDAALGREVTDLDLAVAGGEEAAARSIAGRRGHAFQLSERFATWRAVSREQGWHADVAALRGGSIEADLAERDFTVNAAAVPLAGGDPVDPRGALADLSAGTLRAVSERSFTDDPLRLLRAARLGASLGLYPEPGTVELARSSAELASQPAGERIFAELRGLLTGPEPLRGLELMDELGITGPVLPELEALRGVVQNPNHHLDVYGHTIAVLEELLAVEADLERFAGDSAEEVGAMLDEPLADEVTRRDALRFGALLHDIGKPATRGERGGYVTFIGHDQAGAELIAAICRRLRTSRKLSEHLQSLALHHLKLGFLVHERPLGRRRIYEYLRATEPVSADVTLLTVADRLAAKGSGPIASPEMIEAHVELARDMLAAALAWRRDPPESPVGGAELSAELGITPGARLGELLEELRIAAYAGEVTSREQALELARSLA